MRTLLSTVIAACLLAAPLAQAQTCTRPADRTAFDIAGLKSQLMVAAITCELSERYNSFVLQHRPDLVRSEKVLTAYFMRNFGKRAQAQHDDYITSLANTQSQNGLKAGSALCGQTIPMFDEVMTLHGAAELADYATGKSPVQPIALISCATPARRAVLRTASAAVVTKTR